MMRRSIKHEVIKSLPLHHLRRSQPCSLFIYNNTLDSTIPFGQRDSKMAFNLNRQMTFSHSHSPLAQADIEVIELVSGGNWELAPRFLLEEAKKAIQNRGDPVVINTLGRNGLNRPDHWPLYLFALSLCVQYPMTGSLLVGPSMAGNSSYGCFYCAKMFTYAGGLRNHVDNCADQVPMWMKRGLLHSLTIVCNNDTTMSDDNRELARAIRNVMQIRAMSAHRH